MKQYFIVLIKMFFFLTHTPTTHARMQVRIEPENSHIEESLYMGSRY